MTAAEELGKRPASEMTIRQDFAKAMMAGYNAGEEVIGADVAMIRAGKVARSIEDADALLEALAATEKEPG